MREQVREEPSIIAAAERQMREWTLSEELADRAMREHAAEAIRRSLCRFVTISREAGAGGSEVAQVLGTRLGWQVFDANLLDRIADRFHEDRLMLELVDETESNWVYDVLGTWMDRKIIPHEKYISQLTRVILAVARCTNGVFVGRGAQFILPRDRGLNVRLVAPEPFRVERIARLRKLDPAAARQWIQEVDRGRAGLVTRFFHRDLTDPHLYDMVINVARFGIAATVELILAAMRKE